MEAPRLPSLILVSIHAPVKVRPGSKAFKFASSGFNPRTREGATLDV